MRILLLVIFLIVINNDIFSQRGRNSGLSDMTPEEIEAKRYNDSIRRYMDSFESNFDLKTYFEKLREIQRKNDTIQLNETLDFLKSIAPNADTMQSLTIQASALSVFPNDIKKFKKLKTLTLRRCQAINLEDLFDKIQELPELTELNILFSEKAKLPNNISKLKHLKYLNLNGNKLNALPDGMKNMASLKTLNLHNNPYLDPEQAFTVLGSIKTLTKLEYTGCRMGVLPDNISLLNQLDTLDLSQNGLSYIPESINQLTELKSLNLSRNSPLNALDILAKIAKVPSLVNLDLSDCRFTEIPATIGTLVNIESLNLWNNPLTKINSSIGNLTKIQELIIGSDFMIKDRCQLGALPDQLSNCVEMRKLVVKNAGLKNVSNDFKNFQKLEYLDLGWNELEEYPEFIGTLSLLKHLNLNQNRISELPANFGRITNSLESLSIEANFYSSYHFKIKKLPQGITALTKLKSLSLQDQVYETLPMDFFSSFPDMRYLNLSGALLHEIDDDIENMKDLQILLLKANELNDVSTKIGSLKKLEKLDLAFNPDLNFAQILPTIEKMKQLKEVDISYNDISNETADKMSKAMPNTKIVKFEMFDSPEYIKSRNRQK